jgi:hypothetical protein
MANTYATGPSAGSASSSDPWQSALWTVLIDTDGDGYREFAVRMSSRKILPWCKAFWGYSLNSR